MTNPLRELMIRQAETKCGEYDAAVAAMNAYTQGHLGDIADLIDAAQKVEEMFMRKDATPLMRRERDVLDDHSDALSKLTEVK